MKKENTKPFLNLLLSVSIIVFNTNSSNAKSAAYQMDYYIQIAAFKSKSAAEKALAQYEKKHHLKGRLFKTNANNKEFFAVQIGPYSDFSMVEKTKKSINDELIQSSFIRSYKVNTPAYPGKSSTVRKKTNVNQGLRNLEDKTFDYNLFPYHARLIGDGTWGEQTSFFYGDAMLPLIGNENWIAYVDGSAKYGEDDAWFGGIGGGIRRAVNQSILGGYFFVDRNVSINNLNFLVANPGIELMTTEWDAHFNGYLPLSSRNKSLGVFRGQDLGIPDALHFENHTLYEHLFKVTDTIGPGLDGEIGYTMPKLYNIRAFVGGYHFNLTKAPTINGALGGVEIPFSSKASLLIHDAYDNVQGNTFMGTVRITLGGIPKSTTPNIHDRMLDPLRRNLGSYQTGAGVPIIKTNRQINQNLITNNIWFFNESGAVFDAVDGFANCTFEHPCGEFSQSAIDGINSLSANAKLFVNSGTYYNPSVGNALSLRGGQHLAGRTNYFLRAATGDNRPLINDTLILTTGNRISNVRINGNSVSGGELSGILIDNNATGVIAIKNTWAQAIVTGNAFDAVALNSQNHSASISIEDSDFIAHISNSPANTATGIKINNTGAFQMNGGSVQTSSRDSSGTVGLSVEQAAINLNAISVVSATNNNLGRALYVNNSAQANVTNSTFTLEANNGSTPGGELFAVLIDNGGSLRMDNVTVNLNSKNYSVNNMDAIDVQAGDNLSFINSTINMNIDGVSSNSANALFVNPGANANVLNSSILYQAKNSAGFVSGINNAAGNVNLQNSTLSVLSDNSGQINGSYGIDSTGSVNINHSTIGIFAPNSGNVPVLGVQSSGTLTSANSLIFAGGSTPANINALVISNGVYYNQGNTTCITFIDGVPAISSCG